MNGRLPLEGIRVLDNGIVQAGTFPARLLSDFGAEVVRVENYCNPDLSRNAVFPDGRPGDPYWEGGGTYHEQFRNKSFSVGLDVRKPEGRDAFLRLVKVSDIVLDSHPPGVLDRLQLGYEALREAREDIIFVSTSGYGFGGPLSPVRSYGMMTELMCGSAWLNGYPGEPPRRGACPLTDHPAVFHAAFLMMAALLYRRRTGRGTWLDISQYEAAVNVLGDAHLAHALGAPVPTRVGNNEPGAIFSGCFRCKGEDRWITISVPDQQAWQGLCTTVGLEDSASRQVTSAPLDTTLEQRLRETIAAWAEVRSTEEAFAELSAAGVPSGPVNNVRDLLLDPHLEERGFFWGVEHAPEQHSGWRAWPGASARLTATPARLRTRAPMLGEHNRLIATTLMGYSDAEFEQLEASGAFGTRPLAAESKPAPQDPTARLGLGPAASSFRAKEIDRDFKQRLKRRFGDQYGEVRTAARTAAHREIRT